MEKPQAQEGQQLASAREEKESEVSKAHEIHATIVSLVDAARRPATSCLHNGDALPQAEREMLNLHIDMLRAHSAAIKERCDQQALPHLKSAEKSADEESGPSPSTPGSVEALLMLRERSTKPDPTDGKIVVATERGDSDSMWRERLNDWWAQCMNRVSRPNADWCKAGGAMWDHAQIKVPREWLRVMMSLKEIDESLARSAMAAVYSAVTTTVGPVDIDSIFHALITFVHTCPAFGNIIEEARWELPFGPNTEYVVSQPGELEYTED